jgi:hypothetical protein
LQNTQFIFKAADLVNESEQIRTGARDGSSGQLGRLGQGQGTVSRVTNKAKRKRAGKAIFSADTTIWRSLQREYMSSKKIKESGLKSKLQAASVGTNPAKRMA